ncbi:MAG: hypothetical protein KJZ86_06485 [Caldilineaceae bacterium]|nr:hypothetical protein [Caldilineaceae bacterium]
MDQIVDPFHSSTAPGDPSRSAAVADPRPAVPLSDAEIVSLVRRARSSIHSKDALRAVTEQAYFWTPEWQAKENTANLAIAEGRMQTFDRIDEMIEFLVRQ